jgi:hypothetical protein
MKNTVSVYMTPDGREVVVPAELAAKTKFTKDGMPDRRLRANAAFVAWADEQDKQPNARVEGGEAVCAECGQAVGHYDDCATGMGADVVIASPADQEAYAKARARGFRGTTFSAAQAYARRVWDGQSPEVHREERLRRVKLALDGQGLSMEGVEL